MAARHTEYFTVSRPDDLDELERRLADEAPGELTLDIPEGATTLFSAREFRRLAAAAEASGCVVRIATDDPLRRELARIIGLPVVVSDPPQPNEDERAGIADPAPSDDEQHDDTPTRRIDVSSAAPSKTVEVPLTPWRGLDTAVPYDEDEVDDESYSFVITPPTSVAPGRTENLDASWTAWASRPFEIAGGPVAPPRRRSRRGPRLVVTLVALLVVAASLVAIVAPAATIAVSPRVQVIEAQVSYGLAAPGRSFDVSIAPVVVSTTLTASASIPTTGERFIPDATATGSLLLTNPSLGEVFVPAGTTATAASGVEYVLVDDVVVPAADPYGSATFGSAIAPIRAAAPGTDGNADASSLYGQWDTGVFYTNRDPIAGGTMKRVATVSDSDRAALEATVRGDLEARAPNALAELVPAGASLLVGSEERGEATIRFDHATGEDAATLRAEASMPVSGQVFDPAAMRDRAAEEVSQRLTDLAGDGQIIDGSVKVGDPQPLGASPADGFTIAGQARMEQPLDRAALQTVRDGASGADTADVMAEARHVEGVEAASIEQRHSWLWSRMPLLTSRIAIEVRGAQTTVPTEATPTGP